MDNRIEFIEQLKKIIKEYNIINCNDTPEAMAEEVAKAIESALFDYQRKKIIGVEGQIVAEYNQLMKDSTTYGNKSNINHILTYGNLFSFLKEGESSKDKRITRLDSKYAIYRDNNTGEYIGVFRNLNDKSQALIIRIREGKDPLISYHELNANSSNYNREDILKKIANTKIEEENIDGQEKIFDNK